MISKFTTLVKRIDRCINKAQFDYADPSSRIFKILETHWKNYKTDPQPLDRRMDTLQKNGVEGMSTENIRFLINEIVRQFAAGGVYLEIGIFQGCSLVSASLFNPTTRCLGIDHFAHFNDNGHNEGLLRANLNKFKLTNAEYLNRDYKEGIREIFSKEPNLKVDVYFYDGAHDFQNQLEGLSIMLPYLKPQCVILVDDVNIKSVRDANIEFCRQHPEFKTVLRVLTPKDYKFKNWWNGFEVITRGI